MEVLAECLPVLLTFRPLELEKCKMDTVESEYVGLNYSLCCSDQTI